MAAAIFHRSFLNSHPARDCRSRLTSASVAREAIGEKPGPIVVAQRVKCQHFGGSPVPPVRDRIKPY